jgi:hypothetical protein
LYLGLNHQICPVIWLQKPTPLARRVTSPFHESCTLTVSQGLVDTHAIVKKERTACKTRSYILTFGTAHFCRSSSGPSLTKQTHGGAQPPRPTTSTTATRPSYIVNTTARALLELVPFIWPMPDWYLSRICPLSMSSGPQ